jgi:hypothetical protein
MNAPLVVLTNPIDAAMQAELERHARVLLLTEPSADAIRAAVAQADAVIVRAPLPDDVFTHGPYLVGAVRHGAGVDMIPVDAATAAGVAVANVPGRQRGDGGRIRDRTDAGAEPPPHTHRHHAARCGLVRRAHARRWWPRPARPHARRRRRRCDRHGAGAYRRASGWA